MARTANYEQKIENITAKIEKKAEEIKALKAQLADLEAKKRLSQILCKLPVAM